MSGIDAASMAISARSRLGRVGRNRAQILEAMRTLGVDDLAHRNFSGLSGGQQQRLLLAGAVACKPDILVLDEPTEGLDLRSRKNLLDFLRGALSTGLCIALISHDVQDILQSCDEVAWLHPGEDIGQPSTVEMITPNDLADRVTHARRAS
jgi:ABC-type Mn2+/Zn2+ transport system ATPase subunit